MYTGFDAFAGEGFDGALEAGLAGAAMRHLFFSIV
jgi:hypothetical protein